MTGPASQTFSTPEETGSESRVASNVATLAASSPPADTSVEKASMEGRSAPTVSPVVATTSRRAAENAAPDVVSGTANSTMSGVVSPRSTRSAARPTSNSRGSRRSGTRARREVGMT